jgi:hypothetical protein
VIPARHLLAFSWLTLSAAAAPGVSTSGSLTATWNDNLSHSADADDERTAQLFDASGSFSQRFPLARDTALVTGGTASVESCPRYHGLDSLGASAQLTLREKFGLGALAPVLSLNTEAGAASFRESARNGWSATVTLGLARRFNDAWRGAVNAEWSHHEARQTVFDLEHRGVSAELSWDVTERWQLGLGAGRQWGQQEANASWNSWSDGLYGAEGPALANYYQHLPSTYSHTFGPGWVGYRIDGHTDLGWVSLSPALAPDTALPLRYQIVEVYGGAGTRYLSHQLSLSLVHRF